MNVAQDVQELELRIKTEKSSFAVGEAVWLEVALRNIRSTPIKTPKYFMLPADEPNKNNLEIHVLDGGGNRIARTSHVMTGRELYYPELYSIDPGQIYQDSIQLAGTFGLKQGRKKIERALWNFGENPMVTSVNDYPIMTPGSFKIKLFYRVNERHLLNLDERERPMVWKGELTSNTVEIFIRQGTD